MDEKTKYYRCGHCKHLVAFATLKIAEEGSSRCLICTSHLDEHDEVAPIHRMKQTFFDLLVPRNRYPGFGDLSRN